MSKLWLATVLKDLKLKQKVFAEKLDIHETRLSQIVNGRVDATEEEIYKICDYLDMSEANLFQSYTPTNVIDYRHGCGSTSNRGAKYYDF